MPARSLRSCKKSGCSALVPSGYCTDHQMIQRKVYDQHRGTAKSRGYDGAWDRVREEALKRDKYLCVICLSQERVTPAKDVDHIIPISIKPESRLDIDNLQSLCRACHVKKTKSESARDT